LTHETIDAARIESGRPNSLKLLFKLPNGSPALKTIQIKKENKVVFELRCANAKGLTVCEVIPPSIHPLGTTYTWTNRDLDNLTVIPEKYSITGLLTSKHKKKQRSPARGRGYQTLGKNMKLVINF